MLLCLTDEITPPIQIAIDFFRKCGFNIEPTTEARIRSTRSIYPSVAFSNQITKPKRSGAKGIDAGLFTFECSKPELFDGEIQYDSMLGHDQQVFVLIHEIAHAIDGLILGKDASYAMLGDFNDDLKKKERYALRDLRLSLRNSRRAVACHRTVDKGKKLLKTAFNPVVVIRDILNFRRRVIETATVAEVAVEAEYYSLPSELFADALLQFLTVKVLVPGPQDTITKESLETFFEDETVHIVGYANFADPEAFHLGFTSQEIGYMSKFFTTIWDRTKELSAQKLARFNAD